MQPIHPEKADQESHLCTEALMQNTHSITAVVLWAQAASKSINSEDENSPLRFSLLLVKFTYSQEGAKIYTWVNALENRNMPSWLHLVLHLRCLTELPMLPETPVWHRGVFSVLCLQLLGQVLGADTSPGQFGALCTMCYGDIHCTLKLLYQLQKPGEN